MKNKPKSVDELLVRLIAAYGAEIGATEELIVKDLEESERSEFRPTVTEAKQALFNLIKEALPKERKGESTHGNCCTCQGCKFPHDECECERNDVVQDTLKSLFELFETGILEVEG